MIKLFISIKLESIKKSNLKILHFVREKQLVNRTIFDMFQNEIILKYKIFKIHFLIFYNNHNQLLKLGEEF